MRKPEQCLFDSNNQYPPRKSRWIEPLRAFIRTVIPMGGGLFVALLPPILCLVFKNNYSAACGGAVLLGAALGDLQQRINPSPMSSWSQEGGQSTVTQTASAQQESPSNEAMRWGHLPYLMAGFPLFLLAWGVVLSSNSVPSNEAQAIISAQTQVLQASDKAREKLDEIGLYPMPRPSGQRFVDPMVRADLQHQNGLSYQDRMLEAQRQCALNKGAQSETECAQQAWSVSMRASEAQSLEKTKEFFASEQWQAALAAQQRLKALTDQTLQAHTQLSSGASLGGTAKSLQEWRLADPMSDRLRFANEAVEGLRARALMGFVPPAGYAGSHPRPLEADQTLQDQAGLTPVSPATLSAPAPANQGLLRPSRPTRIQVEQERTREVDQRVGASWQHPNGTPLSEGEMAEQRENERVSNSIINGNIAAFTGTPIANDGWPSMPPANTLASASVSSAPGTHLSQ